MPGVFETLPALVNGNAELVRRGRYCTITFLVEVGDTAWLISVHEGRVEKVERGPFLMRAWAFAVRAPAAAWQKFWEPVPAPGYHDIFAMTKGGHARVEGNLQPLMANLRFIKDLLAAPRRRA
ncbi:MAG: hypothetical protein AABZ83_09545 [candidate division NC10 bacterium]